MSKLNNFTNNLLPKIGIAPTDLDFSEAIPADIDIDVQSGEVEADGEEVGIIDAEESSKKIATIAVKNITNLKKFLDGNKEETVDNTEFKQLVFENLASPLVTSDPKLEGVRKIWDDVNSLTYSKEDKLIKELYKKNEEKFEVVQDILNTELIKNKSQKNKYKAIGEDTLIKV
jgi:hypothetical protein